jgi:hypothetical protein
MMVALATGHLALGLAWHCEQRSQRSGAKQKRKRPSERLVHQPA